MGATNDKLKEEALQTVQRYFNLVVSMNEILEKLNIKRDRLENKAEN
jgi:hypothetical protein